MRNSEIIKKYGKKYGFDWSKSTGVINRAASMGLSYFDKFKLADDVKSGDKNAIALQDAIIKQAKKELADSIRNIKRRRIPGDIVTQQYTDRALDLLIKQQTRLRSTRSKTAQILEIQNIFRESSDKAFRQTPRQRASAKGIKERISRSADQLVKALESDDLYSNADVVTGELYTDMRRIANKAGISLDTRAASYKQEFGDPYKAIEKAYIEVGEEINEYIKHVGDAERDELISDPSFARVINSLGLAMPNG